jgi:serine/threonine protein kinase
MESSQKIIDNRYIIEQRLGSGGEGVAYLVRDLNSPDPKLRLAAKILEFEGNENEVEYEEDDDVKKKINHNIQVFERIKEMNPQNPNVIRCIAQNKGGIVRDGNLLKNRNYFIFEYAPRGDLWKITQMAGGFSERCAKPIFQKILLGVQALLIQEFII